MILVMMVLYELTLDLCTTCNETGKMKRNTVILANKTFKKHYCENPNYLKTLCHVLVRGRRLGLVLIEHL